MAKHKRKAKNSPPRPEQAVTVTLAGFGRRLMAWIYDLLGGLAVFILALAVGQLLIYVATFWWVDDYPGLTHAVSLNPLWAIYLFACVQYYYCWCWVKGGQTVGMKTWRMQLLTTDKKLLSWKHAYLRSFLSLAGLANIWSLFDEEKRGWHDIAANSLVVVYPKGHRWVEKESDN